MGCCCNRYLDYLSAALFLGLRESLGTHAVVDYPRMDYMCARPPQLLYAALHVATRALQHARKRRGLGRRSLRVHRKRNANKRTLTNHTATGTHARACANRPRRTTRQDGARCKVGDAMASSATPGGTDTRKVMRRPPTGLSTAERYSDYCATIGYEEHAESCLRTMCWLPSPLPPQPRWSLVLRTTLGAPPSQVGLRVDSRPHDRTR